MAAPTSERPFQDSTQSLPERDNTSQIKTRSLGRMSPIRPLLLLSHAVFCLGVYGILTRRNAIGLLLSVELILNAAALNFVLFSRAFGEVQAQAFALFIIALAACEAVVGLAIILSLSRTSKTVFADYADLLKG